MKREKVEGRKERRGCGNQKLGGREGKGNKAGRNKEKRRGGDGIRYYGL